MWGSSRVAVIIPALNEEQAIGHVLSEIPAFVDDVLVVDNGSTDATAEVARTHGARVIHEARRGYGSACLAGIAALSGDVDIVVFVDADRSDRPSEMGLLLAPLAADTADFVVGSRVLGNADAGSLTAIQRFGNALACSMMRLFFRAHHTDLGPFRAIRRLTLESLQMTDRNYGWTVQMQVRAAHLGVRTAEIPVSYRTRIGESKISGTMRGVVGAGTKIIGTILVEAIRHTAKTPSVKKRG